MKPYAVSSLAFFLGCSHGGVGPAGSGSGGAGGGIAPRDDAGQVAAGGAGGAGGEGGSPKTDTAVAGQVGSADSGQGAAGQGAGGAGPGTSGPFRHPGVLVNKEQLDFIKAKVAAGAQPWKAAFDRAAGSTQGSLSYAAHPVANVVCGSYSNPDIGCSDEKRDVAAAYTHALLWYFTGTESHARKAIDIMNAWSAVLKEHTNSNGPVQAGWAGSVFPRAAEIIRHTYSGWAQPEIDRFAAMLRTVYLPVVLKGATENGNWELSMIEAAIGSAVFIEDRAAFDQAVSMWRKRVPAYIYLLSDGPQPVPPPAQPGKDLVSYWQGQSSYQADGIGQETCRDLGHMQYGLAAIVNTAETALIQGIDLYGAEAKRISAGLEFNAQFLDGVPAPGWLCGGNLSSLSSNGTWEIGYNHFANRAGLSLPHTRNVVTKGRPTGVDHHMEWETLTHAELGSVGIPARP